jgi:hypothetical protein
MFVPEKSGWYVPGVQLRYANLPLQTLVVE